jgi:hypothetical protein
VKEFAKAKWDLDVDPSFLPHFCIEHFITGGFMLQEFGGNLAGINVGISFGI